MNKIKRIFGYGFLLYVVFNVVLLVLSIIFRSETEINRIAGVFLAVIMVLIMRWIIIKKFKINVAKDALVYSAGWTIIIFILLLVVTVANATAKVLFGNWITYVIMVIMVFCPLLELTYKQPSSKEEQNNVQ